MRKSIIVSLLSCLLIVMSCFEDDDFGGGNILQPVPFTITVKYDQSVGGYFAKNTNVILKNESTGEEVKGKTDENGELKLSQVLPGTYLITADITLNKQEYYELFGVTTNKEETSFNGSQEKVSINTNISSTIITLSNGTVGDFVVKQYYYAGSNTALGALFRDQFVEIHNNSNKVLYADGLYLAFLEGNTNDNVTSYTLPNGQFDWSLSPGNSIGSAANTDYVYAAAVVQIPGTGNQYPVQPGESIVIAQTAINHKAPYTNNNGVGIEIKDPSLTIDLSNADFEVYLGDYFLTLGSTPLATDIQNPAVPDLNIVSWNWSNKDLLMNSNSRTAVVIFNGVTEAEVKAYPKVASPKSPTGNTYTRLPKSIIMDGVDIGNKTTAVVPKDLPNDIDAGRATIMNAAGEIYGDYTSYSVVRKKKSTIGGRVILQDTNNSTNDFVTIKANPKGYAD